MNSIWTHRRLRLVVAAAATVVTGAALASAALAGMRALDLGPAAASQYPKKVTVCHRTHSKKHPWVKISISTHALKAHLRHGDFVVDATHPCPPPTTASAKNKHHGKGKGKHHQGSTATSGQSKHHQGSTATSGKSKHHQGSTANSGKGRNHQGSAAKNKSPGNSKGGNGHAKK